MNETMIDTTTMSQSSDVKRICRESGNGESGALYRDERDPSLRSG